MKQRCSKIVVPAMLLLVLSALLAPGATAETYVVNQTSGPYTTITAAVTAANASPGADVIQITDSATYSENPPNCTDSVTIEATNPTAGPTIIKTAGGIGGAVFVTNPPGNGHAFVFRGYSSTVRMTLTNTNNAGGGVISTGANLVYDHNVTIENLTLNRPTTGTASNGGYFNLTHGGAFTATNVDFTGRAEGALAPAVVANIRCSGGATMTNVDFRCNGNGTRMAVGTHPTLLTLGAVTLNNCVIAPDTGEGAAGIILAAGSPAIAVTFNDCSIGTGGGAGYARFMDWSVPSTSWIFNRPTFLDGCGDVAFYLGNGGTLTFKGTPTAKVNFDPITAGGNTLPIRCAGGTVTLTDCKSTVRSACGSLMDSYFGAAPPMDLTVNMDRCYWLNGSGRIYLDPVAGANYFTGVSINATNTIWRGNGDLDIIHIVDAKRQGQGLVALSHCTMGGTSASYMVNGNATGADFLFAEYCIFDSHLAPTLGSNLALNGTKNIAYKAWPADSGFPMGVPPDTIVVTPNLAGGASVDPKPGHLTDFSRQAFSGAVGSTLNIDVDGDARPLGGAVNDIGADERADPPLSTVASVAILRQQPEGFYEVTGKVTGTYGGATGAGWFYIEDSNRAAGIKCDFNPTGLTEGDTVTVRAYKYRNTDFNDPPNPHEYVLWSGEILSVTTPGTPLEPLAMANRAFESAWDYKGQDPYGLFVKVCGKVTQVVNAQTYYIDDGSGNTDPAGYPGLCVFNVFGQPQPAVGDYVMIEGCAAQHSVGASGGGPETVIPIVWQSSLQTIP